MSSPSTTPRGLRPSDPPSGPGPVRLRRGDRRDRRRRGKAALAVMTLPYSDAFFVSAYPRECTETFQAAHLAAFGFFGGVPVRTCYDNTSIAVKKVVGRERELTREFLRLESHFLFCHRFCRVGPGQREGPRREPGRLLEAEPPGPRSGLRLLRRAERVPRGLPQPICSAGSAASPRPRQSVSLSTRRAILVLLPVLRGAPGRAAPCQLALPRAFRPQRLLGADRLRPPRAHRHRRDRRGALARRHRARRHPSATGERAGQLRPPPLPGALGAKARSPGRRPPPGGLGAARVLLAPAPAARG